MTEFFTDLGPSQQIEEDVILELDQTKLKMRQ